MNRSFAAPAVALLVVSVLVSACGQAAAPSASTPGSSTPNAGDAELAVANVPRASADPAGASQAATAVNAFGFDLLGKVTGGQANSVVSPASIVLALAMARAGAKGETAAQMDAVLHDVATDAHAPWLNALAAALTSRSGSFTGADGKDQQVTLRIANAPFAQRGMPIEPAYLDALASRFGAGLRLVDYVTNTEAARQTINGWVSDQTEQRIKELLVSGTLDPATRLVLVNAIYLKAAWQMPFADGETKPADFTRADGSIVQAPTMHIGDTFSYAEDAGWQAVELPYVGGSLAMDIILPGDLASFEAGLDATAFSRLVSGFGSRQVILSLPKFSIETKTDLAAVLAALGMPLAFDAGHADFSGITTAESLYISKVIHQANIDVDEKGTEAAAATAVVMDAAGIASPPVVLNVDRPFLFALRDVPTGAVLFLGTVGDPSK